MADAGKEYNESARRMGKKGYEKKDVYGNISGSGGGSQTCFPRGTMIKTPTGIIDIEDVFRGMKVYAYNIKKNKLEVSEVLKKIESHESRNVIQFTLNNGDKILTTKKHSFWKNGCKWSKASNIKVGDSLNHFVEGSKSQFVVVVGIQQLMEKHNVFNIVVDEQFTFIANNVLVHSFSSFKWFWIKVWKVKSWFNKQKMNKPILEQSIYY